MHLLASTYARVLALQVLSLLLVLLAAAGSIRWYLSATSLPLARQAYAQLAATDALLSGDQPAALAALRAGQIVVREQPPSSHGANQPFLQQLRTEVGKLAGGDSRVVLSAGNDARLWLRSQQRRDAWIGLTVTGFRDRAGRVITAIVASACLIALLAAALIARVLVRPLEQLARQADSLVSGAFGALKLDDAPSEVKTLAAVIARAAENTAQTQRERETLLASISHDLRSPLTRLRLALELNDHQSLAPREAMIADITEMDGIIESCLAFVRDGRDEPQRLIDLGELLRELVAQRTFPWSINAPDDLVVLARPIGLRRALGNVLGNAEQHGAAPFEIRLSCTDQQVELQIADGGPGVAPALLPRLGEPFFRADAARNSAGNGVGLSISKRALALDGATVQLSNRDTGGFLVEVSFPAKSPKTVATPFK